MFFVAFDMAVFFVACCLALRFSLLRYIRAMPFSFSIAIAHDVMATLLHFTGNEAGIPEKCKKAHHDNGRRAKRQNNNNKKLTYI